MRTTAKMGLTSWDQLSDPYNYAQLAQNWQIVDFHDHSPGRGTPVAAGGLAAGAVLSGSIAAGVVGTQHLSTTGTLPLIQALGLNGGGVTGRGVYTVGTPATTLTSAFPTAIADVVNGVTLDTNGLIFVAYHALWKVSAGTGSADIFLGSTEVAAGTTINGVATGAPVTTTQTHLSPLYSSGAGLGAAASNSSDASEVTTGETVGGAPVAIFATPGTYNVGIQVGVSGSNTLTIQNRHLWVWTMNFQ